MAEIFTIQSINKEWGQGNMVKKRFVPMELSCHKEYSCEISEFYHSLFKVISKVKVLSEYV